MSISAVLPDELLERIHDRAAGHDLTNTFVDDDLAELTASGYLRAAVPATLGGFALTLADVALAQQRLARAAPATALAINMHLVWTTVARVLHDRGDSSLDFVLEGAAAGEVYAFGISEADNDLVLFGSHTEALPEKDGGYSFTGTKVFTSLAPAWTSLGTMGLDTTSPDAPKIVYGFVGRDNTVTTDDDWDALGMRGSQSRTTHLAGAHSPANRIVRRLTPGPNGDPLIFGIFACFEILVSSVYAGIAERALELAVDAAHTRRSQRTGQTRADDPNMRWRIASAAITFDAIGPQISSLAADVDAQVDHGSLWFAKLAGLKVRVTDAARSIVDEAMHVAGGGSYRASHELSRLYRDVLAGQFHPSDAESAHSTVANAILGPPSD